MPSYDNLGEFLVSLDQWKDKQEQLGAVFALGVATKIHARIVERTPVGAPGRKGSIPGALKVAWLLGPNPVGYEITNDKPYGPVVEFGLYPGVGPRTIETSDGIFSTQAPVGMVRLTLTELDLLVAEVLTELNL